jgi:hypothetical protein
MGDDGRVCGFGDEIEIGDVDFMECGLDNDNDGIDE